MKKYNIVTSKKYVQNGQEKTQCNTVGTLVYFPANGDKGEGFALELNMYPATKFSVFEKTNQTVHPPLPTVSYDTRTSPTEDYPDGIDTSEIPF